MLITTTVMWAMVGVSAIGLLLNIFTSMAAVTNYWRLKVSGVNGPRQAYGEHDIVGEILRLFGQLLLVLMAVVIAVIAQPYRLTFPVLTYMAVSLVLSTLSVNSFIGRWRVLNAIDAHERALLQRRRRTDTNEGA